jgi:peptidoglycan/LPS O-acetylase OafA/YrhL
MFNHVHAVVPRGLFGWLGVDVFFVLSGFLITTLLLREKRRKGSISLRGFYTRRFFRIIPVYLFTVCLYFAAVHASRDFVKIGQFNAAVPWLLTFLQEYRPAAAGNIMGHAWTLGIEEKFYIVWPLILIFLYPFRVRALVCLGAIYIALLFAPHTYARSYDGLLCGAVLAVVLTCSPGSALVKVFGSIPDIVLCALVAGTYALNGYSNNAVFLFSGAVTVLVASLVLRQGMLRRLLEAPALTYIGRRSYAMYLIHGLVLNLVEKIPAAFLPRNAILMVCVAYGFTLAGAALMYIAIEQPCIALGRRLSKRFEPQVLADPNESKLEPGVLGASKPEA